MAKYRVISWSYCISFVFGTICFGLELTDRDVQIYRKRVADMFYHAYDSYIHHAFPYDELRPLTCDGMDTWGSFSLTLIDALDTLAVLENYTEFRRVAQLLTEDVHFDMNINVSVFETNIRVIGGLLSAHLMSQQAGITVESHWPCSGPLLRLAETVARKLLPAFDTPTGMPYGTVNLRYGVPKGETPITCTAGVTTYIVEFGTLSRLTGDPIFEQVALRALLAMWEARSSIGLVGNHIDILTGKWTAIDSGIGAGVDSYFEYLVKGAILLERPELMSMFQEYRKAIDKHMLRDDWYMWVNMQKGQVTMPLFQSLEAYWPGLLSLIGDIQPALKSLFNYHQVWKQYGFTPEFYNIPASEANVNREGYPLRPELIESIMYLYQATKDPYLMRMGVDIMESIQYSARTSCGYATIKDVRDHKIENRMESFFLAETTKYLYLLFDRQNFFHSDGSHGTVIDTPNGKCIVNAGGYVFNTEAHPIDISAVYCCSAQKKKDDVFLEQFQKSIDLLSFYGLNKGDSLKKFRQHHKQQKQEKQKQEKAIREQNSKTEEAQEKPKQTIRSNTKTQSIFRRVKWNEKSLGHEITEERSLGNFHPRNIYSYNTDERLANYVGHCKKETFQMFIISCCQAARSKPKTKMTGIEYLPDEFNVDKFLAMSHDLLNSIVRLNEEDSFNKKLENDLKGFVISKKNFQLQETSSSLVKGYESLKKFHFDHCKLNTFKDLLDWYSMKNLKAGSKAQNLFCKQDDKYENADAIRKINSGHKIRLVKEIGHRRALKGELSPNKVITRTGYTMSSLAEPSEGNSYLQVQTVSSTSPEIEQTTPLNLATGTQKVVSSEDTKVFQDCQSLNVDCSLENGQAKPYHLAKNYETDLKSTYSFQYNHSALKCTAQPFLIRFSLMGEMFGIK